MANSGAIVYLATNATNGKRYVGVTKNRLRARMLQHFGKARRGSHYRFHCAIRKYGDAAFTFEIVDRLPSYQEALAREVLVIAELKPEYNVTAGGEGVYGLKRSPELCALLRAQKLANPMRYWLGKKRDADTIAKISASKRGRKNPLARETIKRNHASMLEASAAVRRRSVKCVNDGRTFTCAQEAAAAYEIMNWRSLYHAIHRNSVMRGSGLSFVYGER